MNSSPFDRTRRNRRKESLRRLVRETNLSADNFIQPLFVRPGEDVKREIPSMPGQYQMSIDYCVEESKKVEDKGIPAVILFGIPEEKDEEASRAYARDGIVQKCLREIRRETEQLTLIADVCLCEYMSHGHCGVVRETSSGSVIDNDRTLPLLGKTAVAAANAGADVVAPSGMMDGMVQRIRNELDENGHDSVSILSYAAKYNSSFYGPFRDAAESPPAFGSRATYQMDSSNRKEAIREIKIDVREGADMVMVKPALSYLDIIKEASQNVHLPLFAYSVSGEFAMIKAAARNGWLDEQETALEMMTSIKRAGADAILTYWARDLVDWIKNP